MSKYRPYYGETANGSLNQLWFLGSYLVIWKITVAILELIQQQSSPLREQRFFNQNQRALCPLNVVSVKLWADRRGSSRPTYPKVSPYQRRWWVYAPTRS
ncbi:hypothetical protein JTE90_015043 [Oedothorax gibbosus]|uniref:Uncharacterized protein n=1 Tax=Oedothorax gibbosus TaxID=931172 RepID=A0AAV6TMJ6_9ARAC|nr:hypothetical protein JTE90_015043 [Oedothorax gibbosus]